MKLESQVCSLESAKRLRELGVKQESLFYWTQNSSDKPYYLTLKKNISDRFGIVQNNAAISAFTVAELGEMLPNSVYSKRRANSSEWFAQDFFSTVHRNADTEAESRAKMLVYLLENKLI